MNIHRYYEEHNYARRVSPARCLKTQMSQVISGQREHTQSLGHAFGTSNIWMNTGHQLVQSPNGFLLNTTSCNPYANLYAADAHSGSDRTLASGNPVQLPTNVYLPEHRSVAQDQKLFFATRDPLYPTGDFGIINDGASLTLYQDKNGNHYTAVIVNKPCGNVIMLVPLQKIHFVPSIFNQSTVQKTRPNEKLPRKLFGEHFMNVARHEAANDGVSDPKKSRKQKARPKVTGAKSRAVAEPAQRSDTQRDAHEAPSEPVLDNSSVAKPDDTRDLSPTCATASCLPPPAFPAPAGRTSKTSQKKSNSKTKKQETEPQQPITDFFPIRRSDRRLTSRELKKVKEKELHQKILSGCEEGLEVVDIEGKGRGVVAARSFDRDEFIVEYAGELVNITTAKQRESLYEKDEQVGCYMYYFVYQNKQYCIDATAETGKLGRLLNHSRKGNCHTKVVPVNGHPYLVLVASRDIEEGEELTYDYGDRSHTAIQSHPWLRF